MSLVEELRWGGGGRLYVVCCIYVEGPLYHMGVYSVVVSIIGRWGCGGRPAVRGRGVYHRRDVYQHIYRPPRLYCLPHTR